MTASAQPRAMDDQPASTEEQTPPGTIFTPHRRTQVVVTLASVLCFLIFWWGGKWMHVPAQQGFQGSLLQQSGWPLAIIATYVMLIVCVAVASAIGGRFWFFTGLFAATIGLMALSARGGPSRYVLFDAAARGETPGIFFRLLIEQCLLFIPIALLWTFFWRRYDAAVSVTAPPGQERPAASSLILSVLAEAVLMGLIVLLLAPTDAKKQDLVGVFIGGLVGSSLVEYLFPHPKAAAWYWVGPFLVGAIGYAAAYVHATPWTTGTAQGALANLSHPLPLDYASAGVAGAIMGFWISGQRVHMPFRVSQRPDSGSNDASAGTVA